MPGDDGLPDRLLVGGRVLSLASPLQRYLRDALAACQRIGVSEENYERLGRLRVAPADR